VTQKELILRGKKIGAEQLDVISRLSQEFHSCGRCFISQKVCQALGWLQPNRKPQDVACREILRRLEALGFISLPRPMRPANNELKRWEPGRAEPDLFSFQEPAGLQGNLRSWVPVSLRRVDNDAESRRWRALVARYHYLGYAPMVGRSLKYFIELKGGVLAGAISWGSSSWKLALRDSFIGWGAATRIKNLGHLAGNHRFLILPWVRVKNLASHVLSLAARQTARDWRDVYGLELYLLESFVDASRFKGTCYKASNWICLGQSKGASKSGNSYRWHGQIKDIYVLPLVKDFRQRLFNGDASA